MPDTPTSSVTTVTRAHAKLTLSLRIAGLRNDGFHLIDAEMASLELHDELAISVSMPTATRDPDETGLTMTGPFAGGVPLDHSNLVWRALDLAERRAHIAIDKRIPHGGGLGGGSTDAAAVLSWAGFGTDTAALQRAARLGADIPFCLIGGRARVSGIGEIVAPIPHRDLEITLIVPPLRVSTPAAYRAWDELSTERQALGVNHLEEAAIVVEPELRRWRDLIGDRIGTPPTLAGSGATWFVLGDHADLLEDLQVAGATVVSTRTVGTERATGPGA